MTDERQTILVVDDAAANLQMLVTFLDEYDHELVVAADGREALERAESARPDLILLDVMMPELDGFEVCRRLKANPALADIPVIFMTALSAQSDKMEGFAAGGVDYLTKPLQLDEVRARIDVHLSLRALQRRLTAQNEELHAKEHRLAEAQRIAHLGSWELDLTTSRLEWSDEVFRIFEIDKERFGASYEAFLATIHPDDRDAVGRAYAAAVEHRAPYNIVHRLLLPDGRIKHVHERCETYYGADGTPLRSIGTVQDVTATREAEMRLRQSRDLLRALVAENASEKETERRELARKIHEDLAQILSSLRLGVASFSKAEAQADAGADMARHIDRAIHLSREMVAALRPTVLDLGAGAALRWLARDFGGGLGLCLEANIDEDIALDDERTVFVFRAAQELLFNVALHAVASSIWLSFTVDGERCRLAVRDDGRGFDPAAPREDGALGLASLAERSWSFGGELTVASAPGQGTRAEISLPWPPR